MGVYFAILRETNVRIQEAIRFLTLLLLVSAIRDLNSSVRMSLLMVRLNLIPGIVCIWLVAVVRVEEVTAAVRIEEAAGVRVEEIMGLNRTRRSCGARAGGLIGRRRPR